MTIEQTSWELVLELIVLAAAPWPLLRLLLVRPFRRALPRYVLTGGLLIAAYATVVVSAALLAPFLLRPVALLAAIGMVWMWFRARPAYGASKNLPPGSLAFLPSGPWVDHLFYLKQAQRYGPIFKSTQFLKPSVSVLGIERARALLREHDDEALRAPLRQYHWLLPCPFMRNMYGSQHEKYRRLFQRAFSKDAVRQCELSLNRIARDAMRPAAGESGVRPAPLMRATTHRMLVRLMLGVEPGSEEFAKLDALYDPIEASIYRRAGRLLPVNRRRATVAIQEVTEIISRKMVEVAGQLDGGEEPPPSFLRELVQSGEDVADDEVALFNLAVLASSGMVDVAALLVWILKMLCDNPSWQLRLREALESGSEGDSDPDGLANRIVMETLRLHQSERLDREVVEDIVVDGYTIPKGWLLRVRISESHRNADVFKDPHAFNPDRFLDFRDQASEFAPLGMLKRSCIGDHATRGVARAFVRELVMGYDSTVVVGGPDEPLNWHWAPNRDLRVRLTERDRLQPAPVSGEADLRTVKFQT